MKVDNETIVECLGACLESKFKTYDSKIESKVPFSNDVVQGFIGYRNNALVIVFRGSDEFRDWLFNFATAKKHVPYDNYNSKIRVHHGWCEAYKEKIRFFIHYLIITKKPIKVIVAGQSFGGALATLCAVDLQYNFPQLDIACLPFGSPKVGNEAFVKSFNKRVPDTYRYVYGRDVVPLFPFLGYRAVSFMRKYGPPRRIWNTYIPSILQHIVSLTQVGALKKHLLGD